VREGFISLGLNMSLAYVPLLPLVMIAEVNHARDLFDIVPLFSVLGVLTANAIDIAILSHDKVESPLSATRGARGLLPSSVALVPMLNQGQQGLAVVGRF
jgi:hypothetical protein